MTIKLTDLPLLCELLDRPVHVVVSTVSPKRAPQASVVWAARRDDELVMFFAADSAKVRNLAEHQEIAVLAIDDERVLAPGVPTYAVINGTVRIGPPEHDMLDKLALAYGQSDGYIGRTWQFVTVSLTVERVYGMGPVPGGAAGGWKAND